jgi:hypothetical protein
MAFRTVGPKPQTDLLLGHFRVKPDISGDEARNLFRIKSLPRRILDLEARGHKFSRVHKTDSTGQRYVRYFYLGQQDQA